MNFIMLQEIEQTIIKYFPQKWEKKNISFWIRKSRFNIDLEVLNKNLNIPVRDFLLRGGKRWRPVLFLITLKLLGVNWKKYLDVAFALELAHNATLIIDDIEDSAELRRGKPVCHKIFGIDIAVNTGVIIHFLPLKILLEKRDLTEKQRLKILRIYSEEMINIYFGQTLDIAWHKNPKIIEINKYLEMARLKTGGLIRMAMRIACVLANKDEKFEKNLVSFAELAGIAFQIKDDALEFTSNEKIFGKSFGNDITEGKISLPIIFALQNSNLEIKTRLLQILKLHTRNKITLKEAMNIIKQSGAVEQSLAYADNLIEKSWRGIETKLPQNKYLEDFKNITYFLVKRDK